MSNLKKNGQQMNTGEGDGGTGMDQKKSQILGQLMTQVMSRSLVLPGNITDQDWLSRLLETKETYQLSELAGQTSPSIERIPSDLKLILKFYSLFLWRFESKFRKPD